MMEILGLLDTLETMILDSPKLPLTRKAVIDETKLLQIIDKMRLVISSGDSIVRRAIETSKKSEIPESDVVKRAVAKAVETQQESSSEEIKAKAEELVDQAYQIAQEVRSGADKYADEILANLEMTASKILRQVRTGRERLSKLLGEGAETSSSPTHTEKGA